MPWSRKPARRAPAAAVPRRRQRPPGWSAPRRRRLPLWRRLLRRRPLTLAAMVVALPLALPQLADLGFGLGVRAEGCRVVQVIDGDTLDLWCPGHGVLRSRLMDFDAPEIFAPQCPAELRRGLEATWALRTALWRAETLAVTLHGTDRYDRTLARLAIDGRPVSAMMIEAGHARPYAGGGRGGWCL